MAVGTGAALLGGAVIGGLLNKQAADSAAGAQRDAANTNTALEREMWLKNLELNRPFYDSGVNALSRLNSFQMPSMTLEDFQASPDYQFRVQGGQNALLSGASAAGMRLSGRTLKALQDYGQGMAGQEFGNWYGRRYGAGVDDWNRNAQLAGIGQTANSQAIAANANAANNIANNNMLIANANSAQAMQPANYLNNMLGQGIMAWGMKN